MKQLLTFILLVNVSLSYSQTISFDSIQTIQKGDFTEYISSNDIRFKIGDTLQIGAPSLNDGFNFIVRYFNNNLGSLKKATSNYSGYKAVISKIKIVNSKCIIDAETKNSAGIMTFSIQFEEALKSKEVVIK
jgi:hypothetical protein